jgi:hypothetical protein
MKFIFKLPPLVIDKVPLFARGWAVTEIVPALSEEMVP